MRNRKVLFGMVFLIILIGFTSAVCCERLKDNGKAGAWCQNVEDESDCYTIGGYKTAPTSCESASYCQLGTCINSVEGTCSPNTPQQVCNEKGGLWKAEKEEDLVQCQYGCCLMGDQATFTTQANCKQLSSLYFLETDYRTDIQNEFECIASATSDAQGACVFEEDFQKTCLMITQKQCQEMETETSFHEGFLCSAVDLATNCGARGGTTCVEGRDEVFFLDTCGNLANVYDYKKLNDEDYWTRIQESDCGDGKGSSTCGACDYYSGSTCKAYERGEDTSPRYGNYVCRDLDCGNYKHGESWCEVDNRVSEISIDEIEGISSSVNLDKENVPGSRYVKKSCYNGEIITEPCADFRNEICVQSSIISKDEEFRTSKCIVNKWQDCINQTSEENCVDDSLRYCEWNDDLDVCVPKFAPGLNFWGGTEFEELNGLSPSEYCGLASNVCVVEYEIGVLTNRKKFDGFSLEKRLGACVENCHCMEGYTRKLYDEAVKGDLKKDKYRKNDADDYKRYETYEDWISSFEGVCSALGDCGNKINFLEFDGEEKDLIVKEFVRKG